MYTQQRRLIYPIHITPPHPEVVKKDGLRLIERAIDEGKVEAYLWESPHPAKGLIVYFHGNGSIAENGVAQAQIYHQMGYHVLVPEYRGYGRSDGKPSQRALVEDSLHFIKKAQAQLKPRVLIYHGYSLGGGVSCAVATQHEPDGLVLQSTFTSIKDMASKLVIPSLLIKDPYDTKSFLASYKKGPVLILHGTQDEVIPFEHGQNLAKVSETFTFIEDQGTHQNAFRSSENVVGHCNTVESCCTIPKKRPSNIQLAMRIQ